MGIVDIDPGAVGAGRDMLHPPLHAGQRGESGEDGARESGLLMIASVVVGSMPHLTTPWLKVEALRLIQKAGAHLDDDARLQRLLPHVLSLVTRTMGLLGGVKLVRMTSLSHGASTQQLVSSFRALAAATMS